MRITQSPDHLALDGAGELTFTVNDAAIMFDPPGPKVDEVYFENFHFRGYSGGLWARVKCCWYLWKWLAATKAK